LNVTTTGETPVVQFWPRLASDVCLLTSDLWFVVRSCWLRIMMQTFPMIIEMRTYKIKPGLRAEFLKVFESKARPEHEKIGMKILGPFLSVENADTFFWMRAFPDLKSRGPLRDQFYEGKLWKEELEQKLMPMIEKYDVVVVEAKDGLGEWR
jgi:NIPSNAP